jgi:PAS domain S-box-containing protein
MAGAHIGATHRDPRIDALLQVIARVAGAIVIAVGCLGLLGWNFDIAILKSFLPGLAAMKANTTECFILAGLALAGTRPEGRGRPRYRAARGAAGVVALLAALTLGEYIFGWSLPIDQLLFADPASLSFPGRMAPATALCFCLLGLALLLLDTRPFWLSGAMIGVALLAAWAAIIGYVYGVASLYAINPYSTIAVPTAIALIILGIGMLCARPDRGLIALVASNEASGLMSRRMLPAAIAIPFLLGWARWKGQVAGLYDTEFGLALMVVSITAVFTAWTWWSARSIQQLDLARRQIEETLSSSEERFRAIFNQAAVGLARVGLSGQWLEVNEKLCDIVGYTRAELLERAFQMLTHPDDLEADLFHRQRLLAGDIETYLIEKRYVHKNGAPIWINLTCSLVHDATGAPAYFITVIEDISTRKRAEEKFRLVVEAAPNAIVLANPAGRIHLVNTQAERLFGYAREELLGQPIELLVPAPARAQHTRDRGAFVAAPETRAMGAGRDLFGVRKSGSQVPVEIGLNPLNTSEGPLILASIIDITERKQSEAALRQSEARFATAFRASPAALAISRLSDGRIIEINEGYQRLMEYRRDEVIGHNASELNIYVAPEERADVVRKLREQGRLHDYEVRVRTKSGAILDVLCSIEMIELDGEACNLTIIYNITDRKRAEQALERAADRLRVLADASRAFAQVGTSYQALLDQIARTIATVLGGGCVIGLASEDGVWLPIDALYDLDPEKLEMLRTVLGDAPQRVDGPSIAARIFRSGQPLFLSVVDLEQMRAATKPEYWPLLARLGIHSLLYVPIQVQGRTIGVMSLLRHQPDRPPFDTDDLTLAQDLADRAALAIDNARLFGLVQRELIERTRAEAEVRMLSVELEQRVAERTDELTVANKELEAFSYSVSHDLRAPLRAIDGFSRILVEDYVAELPDEAQRYFQLVRDNTKQMGRLIDDLLAFARLSRQAPSKRTVDSAELVRQCLDELRDEQAGRQIAIGIGELPSCQADPALLKQVWVNLIANALKYSRHRDRAVIEIGSHTDESDESIYFVKDNGAGFDMRYSDKLFGVFQRLHRAEDYEGTGVGLAIVQRIVQRHGGRIWAEAAVDQGATFYFTLGGGTR